jgi:hypothetical protein
MKRKIFQHSVNPSFSTAKQIYKTHIKRKSDMSKYHDTRTNKSGCLYNNKQLQSDENIKLNRQR